MPVNPYVKGGLDVPVVDGGTGASTSSGARTNLDVLDETAHDLLDHTGLTGVGDFTVAAHASVDHSVVPATFFNIGSPTTAATATGDLSAGDGTREMVYDASTGILKMDGVVSGVVMVDLDGSANSALTGLNVKNSDTGTLARALVSVNSDAGSMTLQAHSSGFTPSNGALPSTGLVGTNNGMTGGMNFQVGSAGPFQFGWWQAASLSWQMTTSRHLVTGQTGIDIGTTTDAQQPRDLHLNRALNVGNVTASASEGDITAGIGSAHRLFYDASDNNLSMKTTITPGVESSQWIFDGRATENSLVQQVNTTSDTNTTVLMYRIRRDQTTSTVSAGFGISTDTRMMIQGGTIPVATRTSHVWTNTTNSTALASHIKWEVNATGVVAGTLTEILRLEGDGLITQLAGGIEIGAAVTTTAEVGDFVAGDGTREMFFDASAGTWALTEGNTTFNIDMATGFLISSFESAFTNIVDGGIITAHTTTNTPVAGFGARFIYNAHSSNNTLRGLGETRMVWSTATDGVATADFIVSLRQTGTPTVEAARFRGSDGSLAVVGGIEVGAAVVGTAAAGDILAGDGTNELFWDASAGVFSVGNGNDKLGYSVANALFSSVEDAGTNDIQSAFDIRRFSTNTVVANFGVRWTTTLQDASGSLGGAAEFRSYWTDPVNATATSNFAIVPRDNGNIPAADSFVFRGADQVFESSGGIEVGNPSTTAELGDIVLGDGTREMRWDASTGLLALEESSANALYTGLTITNTNAGNAARARLSIIANSGSGTLTVNSAAFTTDPDTFIISAPSTISGGVVINSTASSVDIRTTGVSHLLVNAGGGVVMGDVAGATATAALGDLVVGDGTREMFFDVSANALSLNGAAATISSSSTLTLSSTGVLSLDSTTNAIQTNATSITADAALDILTTGATALRVDTGGAAALNLGNTSANAVNVGNTSATVGLTGAGISLAGGSSEIDLTTTGPLDLNAGATTLDCSTLVILATAAVSITSGATDDDLTLATGDNGAGDSGNFLADVGTATGTAGDISLGAANAVALNLGRSAGTIGLYGVTAVARSSAYTPTNVSTDRAYDADATSLNELADVVGTLIADLQALGAIG